MTSSKDQRSELLELTSEIVSAHVGNNAVSTSDLPELIASVHAKLTELVSTDEKAEDLTPAVPIRKSVTNDHVVCLECGQKMKMLKRHLQTAHGMTPEAYRERWRLPAEYTMVAPDYAATRRDLAHQIGLGKKTAPRKRKPRAA